MDEGDVGNDFLTLILDKLRPWTCLDKIPDKVVVDPEKWFRQRVMVSRASAYMQIYGEFVTFYHGTITDEAYKILRCGGFVLGKAGARNSKRATGGALEHRRHTDNTKKMIAKRKEPKKQHI